MPPIRNIKRAFAKAFPENPKVNADNLAKAIATYVRTLVSPPTRFDRWVDGDESALTAQEVEGFKLFTGKAGCANCHTGYAFTDGNFYDVGLPDADRGRGAVLHLDARRSRLQNTWAARAQTLGALHARRLARDTR